MGDISNIGSVRTLVELAAAKQIEDVVLSPGSRNAPFILSFNGHGGFNCQSVLDERSAGFIALGIAQQKNKPVILSCTSGSAVLNYTPALVEAFYQKIPLIAVTADRPSEWIDQGEGQSMRQVKLMDNIVLNAFNLVEEHSNDDRWYNSRLINEAMELAISKSMPVQINVPLKEPLYGTVPLSPTPARAFEILESKRTLSEVELDRLKATFFESERVLVLVAQGNESAECLDVLKEMNINSKVAIVTETHANLYHLGFVSCIDRTIESFLNSKAEAEYIPDLLITIGSNVISKKIKTLFRKYNSAIRHHWHFGDDVMDTYQSLTKLISADAAPVLGYLNGASENGSSQFGNQWRARFFEMEQRHIAFLKNCPFSDLKVFEMINDFIPDITRLQMGNSSVVRYIQLFNQLRTVSYFGNRGVSGIEGCTSTAIGAAQSCSDLTLLISGDQAFRYDSNALAVKNGIENLRIIVINNGGGNIFRIIDGPKDHSVSHDYIEKVDEQSIQKLVEYHDIDYKQAADMDALESGLEWLLGPECESCGVLEVFTPRIESPQVFKAYLKFLREGK